MPAANALNDSNLSGLTPGLSSTVDTLVSNDDLDWLFKTRELKKLRKRARTTSDASQTKMDAKLMRHRHSVTASVPMVNSSSTQWSAASSTGSSASRRPSLKKNTRPDPVASRGLKSHGQGSSGKNSQPGAERGRRRGIFASLSQKLRAKKLSKSQADKSSAVNPSDTGPTNSSATPSGTDSSSSDPLSTVSFKRVVFAVDELKGEPQQQIPSRHPHKGTIQMPEDLEGPPLKLSLGVTDPGTHSRRGSSESSSSNNSSAVSSNPGSGMSSRRGSFATETSARALELARERQRRAEAEARRHASMAHRTGLRLAREVAKMKKSGKAGLGGNGTAAATPAQATNPIAPQPEDASSDASIHVEALDIDTPLHHHVNYFDGAATGKPKDPVNSIPTIPSLETLYARCCHLREILPIPITMKQLKGKKRPLKVLKMLNPRPTPIDLLSFSDFLAIAPVQNVVFDNVVLTTRMLHVVLTSLSRSVCLRRLSLRNVAIDAEGWKYLCKFLIVNHSLQQLDISQHKISAAAVAATSHQSNGNIPRASTEQPALGNQPQKIDLATSDLYRARMDWPLFVRSLRQHGGLEELVINGVDLADDQFSLLVDSGLSVSTQRLGIARAGMNASKMTALARWMTLPSGICRGVDLSQDSLDAATTSVLCGALSQDIHPVKLEMLCLNGAELDIAQAKEIIRSLSGITTLRFLDLGGIPTMFPQIIEDLHQVLPGLSGLTRLHFEMDGLSEESIIQLAGVFPDCTGLTHISLVGNGQISDSAAEALCDSISRSRLCIIDFDNESISDELANRITCALGKNLKTELDKEKK